MKRAALLSLAILSTAAFANTSTTLNAQFKNYDAEKTYSVFINNYDFKNCNVTLTANGTAISMGGTSAIPIDGTPLTITATFTNQPGKDCSVGSGNQKIQFTIKDSSGAPVDQTYTSTSAPDNGTPYATKMTNGDIFTITSFSAANPVYSEYFSIQSPTMTH